MSTSANPYQPPNVINRGAFEISEQSTADRGVERTIEALATIEKWVRLIGWSALVVGSWSGLRSFAFAWLIPKEGWGILGLVAVSLINAALFVAGGLLSLRYARGISDFARSRQLVQLNSALEAERTLWRFVGVTVAVLLAFSAAGIVYAFVFSGPAGLWHKLILG